MAGVQSKNHGKALQRSLPHLKNLIKVEKLMPHLSGTLSSLDLRKLNDPAVSNDDKVLHLVEALSNEDAEWWEDLLTSLNATEDGNMILAARILQIEKHSV